MLMVPPSVRVFLATAPCDMRRSFDGLAALVQEQLDEDPFAGGLFLFRNRRGDRIKALYWDLGEAPRYVELWEANAPYGPISQASSPLELHIIQSPSE